MGRPGCSQTLSQLFKDSFSWGLLVIFWYPMPAGLQEYTLLMICHWKLQVNTKNYGSDDKFILTATYLRKSFWSPGYCFFSYKLGNWDELFLYHHAKPKSRDCPSLELSAHLPRKHTWATENKFIAGVQRVPHNTLKRECWIGPYISYSFVQQWLLSLSHVSGPCWTLRETDKHLLS